MQINHSTNKGLSNFWALILIGLGYPIGATLITIGYIALEKNYSPGAKVASRQASPKQKLSRVNAEAIIKAWWSKREKIMAPPYNPSTATDVISTSGPLWQELTSPSGSVSWLRNNNTSYQYISTKIISVISFKNQLTNPEMVVKVRSVFRMIGPNTNKNDDATSDFKYSFVYENSKWKLWDYNQLKK